MSFEKNVSVKSGNRLSLSGSSIETTGSLYGSVLSGTVGQFTSLSSSLVRINNAYTLPTSDGTTGQVISTNGSGQLTFTSVSAGSEPGGPDTSVQFNKSSTLSGSSDLTYNYTTGVLSGTLSSFTQVSASYIDLGYPSEITDHEKGRLYYDDSNNKLKVQTEISSVAEGITEITLGQQLVVRVKNVSGVELAKGKVVHITGSSASDTPLVTTASYESDSVSADTLGVLMSTVANNDDGYAILYGVLTGIDLSSYSVGDMLYLSSSGDFTTTVPQSPLHEVRIGQIIRAGPSVNGAMFVRIQNGYETDELHDVLFSSKAEGDLISWDATTGVWRNKKQLTGSYEISNTLTVGTLVETSTREIKENIKTIPNQLNNLKKLNPVKYNKINSEREEIGLIAEEVQEVYPEFVHNKGINYPKMVSVLISAIQELTTKVEKQQKEITSLKKKIKS